MRAGWVAAAALALLLQLGAAQAALAVHRRVQCGDHACSEYQYCNTDFGNLCADCATLCLESSHNYNKADCTSKCQIYIHDQHFASKSESVRLTNSLNDLTLEVKKLQLLAWLSMTFSGLAALCLFCIGFCKLSKAKRRHGGLVPLFRTKFRSIRKSEKQSVKVVDPTGLKLAIHSGAGDVTAPPTCSTTISSSETPPTLSYKQRCPSEDNTLDYTYDNAGMSPSPTSFAKGVEFNTRGELRF